MPSATSISLRRLQPCLRLPRSDGGFDVYGLAALASGVYDFDFSDLAGRLISADWDGAAATASRSPFWMPTACVSASTAVFTPDANTPFSGRFAVPEPGGPGPAGPRALALTYSAAAPPPPDRGAAMHKHLLAIFALAGSAALAAVDPACKPAPLDGWAARPVAPRWSAAVPSQIYSVSNRSQLLAAISNGGFQPKIIKVVGSIDMTEGQPFTSTADQKTRGQVKLPSNTTLIGAGPGSGFVNAWINIAGVSNVIVRNLTIVAPCDVGPIWDPTDGATGNWNAAYDAISVTGADHVWIDRNTITDVPVTDNPCPSKRQDPPVPRRRHRHHQGGRLRQRHEQPHRDA